MRLGMGWSRPRRCPTAAVWALVASAALVPGRVAASDAATPSPPRLQLAWVDLCRTPSDLQAGAQLHVERLLTPSGIRVSAFRLAPGRAIVAGSTYVVLLPASHTRTPGNDTAGAVMRAEGHHARTMWVFPPAVARTAGLSWERLPHWSPPERSLFARALGIVVVHELAHLLAGAAHRPRGLLKAALGEHDVRDPDLAVDADLLGSLREAVEGR